MSALRSSYRRLEDDRRITVDTAAVTGAAAAAAADGDTTCRGGDAVPGVTKTQVTRSYKTLSAAVQAQGFNESLWPCVYIGTRKNSLIQCKIEMSNLNAS